MSLKGVAYETVEEANMRLSGSVVLYDGEPVYVTRVTALENPDEAGPGGDIARVYISPLPYGGVAKEARKYISSRKFDLSPFRMGWCNTQAIGPVYVSRRPARKVRQGLTAANLVTKSLGGGNGALSAPQLFNDPGFLRCIKNDYPSYKDALDVVKKKAIDGVPVGREFLLQKDEELGIVYLYRGLSKCGLILDDNKVTVPDKFKFLREELEEARIEVA